MRRLHCRPNLRVVVLLILSAAACTLPDHGPGMAAEQHQQLLLDVVIDGTPANMICSFILLPGGVIGATRQELASIGIRADAARQAGDIIPLHDIPTLKYAYDERRQRIAITIADADRLPRILDLRFGDRQDQPAPAGWGAVMNYDLFSSFNGLSGPRPFAFNGTTATLEARAFSPYGILTQSGIISLVDNRDPATIRLDSFYRWSDTERLISWTAGDTVSGGLDWTRPVRIAGVQAQRNFSLRPDLVTMPLPNISGTAAVPSTVDVYVNNVRTYSDTVGNGPFSLTNVPMITGAGNAQVVIRDSSGHETTMSVPFYGSADLLAQGLDSWSFEAGLPRLSYGAPGDLYVDRPVGSATWRQGVMDWFTAEAHGEAGAGLVNGGAGAAVRIGAWGVVTAAGTTSRYAGATGNQAAASIETQVLGMTLSAGAQRSFGDYEDLGAVTARQLAVNAAPLPGLYDAFPALRAGTTQQQTRQLYANIHAPRALDRITLGGALRFDPAASWGVSFVHQQQVSNATSSLVSVSYSRSLPFSASVFVTAYKDFTNAGGAGVLFGVSLPIGGTGSVSSNVSVQPGSVLGTVQASAPLGPEPGSVGWQVQDTEGAAPFHQAAVSYRFPAMTVQASVNRTPSGNGGTLGASGAIAGMGGDVFFSDRIPDAFAVVDAGLPGIAVSYENRPIGVTDRQGMLLVPSLRSYQKNQISIDPANLPVDAEIETTRAVLTPSDRAGTLVAIKVRHDTAAALVVLVRPGGGFVPAGSRGRLEGDAGGVVGNGAGFVVGNDAGGVVGHDADFIVGYDGQAFIRHLAAANRVAIELADSTCHASFAFRPQAGQQVRIGPITCQ